MQNITASPCDLCRSSSSSHCSYSFAVQFTLEGVNNFESNLFCITFIIKTVHSYILCTNLVMKLLFVHGLRLVILLKYSNRPLCSILCAHNILCCLIVNFVHLGANFWPLEPIINLYHRNEWEFNFCISSLCLTCSSQGADKACKSKYYCNGSFINMDFRVKNINHWSRTRG